MSRPAQVTARKDTMMKRNTCTQHAICEASDSNLPICKCWCAECHEIMDEVRANGIALRFMPASR